MEREETKKKKNQRRPSEEYDYCLQWGNRKKLRCVRVKVKKHPPISHPTEETEDAAPGGILRRRVTSRFLTALADQTFSTHPRNDPSESATIRSSSENRKSSPEKEDNRYYTTRGSVVGLDENGKRDSVDGGEEDVNRGTVWPKLYVTLSSKEKEEDFMAMKGCKPPHRPKKRAKIIQRSLLLVSPGAWLSDMCQERYEVREKKSSKKRPRGLKAMGSRMDSDSE